MEKFYQDYKFILSFLVLTLVIQMTLGEKFTVSFLYLVLFSMIMVNSNKFTSFIEQNFFKQST